MPNFLAIVPIDLTTIIKHAWLWEKKLCERLYFSMANCSYNLLGYSGINFMILNISIHIGGWNLKEEMRILI